MFFHVVGYFFSPVEEAEITEIIKTHHLEPYVILYGKKHGKELDEIFDQCDFGIGSLGRHRVGIEHIKTLKNREYAARGIPFVYSETDTDFDKMPYVLKVPANETAVKIEDIIQFYQHLTTTPQQIRDSIADLSWKHQMGKVINTLYPKQEEHLVYGIAGIAQIFGCSIPTASRIKKSGIINDAITQVGRKIVVNADKALELASKHKNNFNVA